MSELTEKLEHALSRRVVEFGNVNNDAHIEGINFHADRLAPLHASLLKCVEALDGLSLRHGWNPDLGECICKEHIESRAAIADLRKALEECK